MAVFLRLEKIISFSNVHSVKLKCNASIQTRRQYRILNTTQSFLFEPFWTCLKGPHNQKNKSLQQTLSLSSIALHSELDESLHTNMALAERLKKHVYDNSNVHSLYDKDHTGKEEKRKLALNRQLVPVAKNVQILLEEMQELEIIVKDQDSEKNTETELVELAAQDLSTSLVTLKEYLKEAAMLLLPDHIFDGKSAVLEVQAGAGGNEASLFAEEIFNLYLGYSAKHFNVEITAIEKHQGDGIDKATAVVNGIGAFRFLKYECGVHRVQRVPKSSTGNKSDRLQTSTCSVAVLPLPDDADYQVPEKELKYEFVKSSGPGGQNVNKVDTACRITHIPTGLSIKTQEFRTQHQNKKRALQQVRSVLYQQHYEEQMKKTAAFRKSQIGNMNRNEKIRTYNFTRNVVIDHRIEKGSRQVSDIADLLTGKLGYDIIHGLGDKIACDHQIKSLDEYLTSCSK